VVRRRYAGRPARRGATVDPLFSAKQENILDSEGGFGSLEMQVDNF